MRACLAGAAVLRTFSLALLIWILTPGTESVVLTDAAWAVCEATAGEDAWRCEDEWYEQGSLGGEASPNW